MKKILTGIIVLLTFALASRSEATPYWAAIDTAAYAGDTTPGTANVPNYSAYYCTAETADLMLGGSSVSAIETYLASHIEEGQSALASSGVALSNGEYDLGQYQFISYFANAISDGSYFGVVFYGTEAFRVFGSDNAYLSNGHLQFDDSQSGTVGSWMTGSSVPEPTSGILLMMGLAILALKRRVA